jgi:molecular chaperone GrpE
MAETSNQDPKTHSAPPAPEAQNGTPAAASPTPALEEQLTAARAEATAAHERYLRAVADHENFRKRTVRERDELRQSVAAGVIEDVVPIMDNLSLAVAAARQPGAESKAIADGVGMVLEQFKSTLARHGLKEINPVGAAFDPNLHECIAHQPDAQVPEEKVIQVVRLGYQLNTRLVRPASVIVSSGPAQPEAKA